MGYSERCFVKALETFSLSGFVEQRLLWRVDCPACDVIAGDPCLWVVLNIFIVKSI
jgi:hypothetical protein